jgi:RNA polymerase sigma-70 factor (ECF subfamily)
VVTEHVVYDLAPGTPAEDALPVLLAQYSDTLFGVGLRMCNGREDAEDLVQETFLTAFRKWHQFKGESTPVAWLYRIAVRICWRHQKRTARRVTLLGSIEDLLPMVDDRMAVAPPADQLDEQLVQESVARLRAAIVKLPANYRMPLVLKDIVGLSVAEVAAAMGLTVGTIKTRVHRARLKLQQVLERDLPRKKLPPLAYARQVCLDLLEAKQEALDRGVSFPNEEELLCERCRAFFARMDLAQSLCRRMGEARVPAELRQRILAHSQPVMAAAGG